MSVKWMAEVWGYFELTQHETLVLLALADHANDDGVCWPSLDHISLKSRCTKDAVCRAIKRLEKLRYVAKRRRAQKTTVYQLLVNRSKVDRSAIDSPESTLAAPESTVGSIHTPNLPNHQVEPSLSPRQQADGAALADPLIDPFSGTDPLRDTKQSKDAKAEERAVGREHLKRTKVNDVELLGTIPYDDIAQLYVKICMPSGFLEFKYLTEARRREIHNRWLEVHKRRELEWWRKYFEYCASCEGLKGKSWANFGFLISDKMIDITEGKYERAFARQH